MSEWRFLAYRPDGLGNETLLHPDLPVIDAKMVTVLSGVNSLNIVIDPRHIDLMGDDGFPIFDRWGTFIYAERDGDIQGGFIVSDIDAQGSKLNITCVGFLGYAKDIPYIGEFIAYEVDPLDMARYMWSHIQSAKMGNIGLVFDPSTTGGKRKVGIRPVEAFRGRPNITDAAGNIVLPALPAAPAVEDQPFKLAWYETHDMLDAFVKLAQESPFDFFERHWWEGGEVQHWVEFDYPQRRIRNSQTRFAVGENVFEPPKYDVAGDSYATDVLMLGAGEGAKMVKAVASDYSQGHLRRAKVIKNALIGRTATAQSQAVANLALLQGDFELFNLTVKDTPLAPYGSFTVGEEIRLITNEDEWVAGQEVWVRVMEIEVQPHNDDDMILTVSREGVRQ